MKAMNIINAIYTAARTKMYLGNGKSYGAGKKPEHSS